MYSFFKQEFIRAVLVFALVPTLLIAKVAIFDKTQHSPLAENLGSIFGLYGFMSLAVFAVVGIPGLAIFRWRRWHSLAAFSFGGAVTALVGEVLIIGSKVVDFRETWTSSSLSDDTVALAVCGFITAAVFWFSTKREIPRGT